MRSITSSRYGPSAKQQDQPRPSGILPPDPSAIRSSCQFHKLRIRQPDGVSHGRDIVYKWLLQSTSDGLSSAVNEIRVRLAEFDGIYHETNTRDCA